MSVLEQTQARFPNRPDTRRQRVFDGAAAAVEMASWSGAIVSLDAEADRLFQERADCPLPVADIRDVIALIAIRRRVPIQLG